MRHYYFIAFAFFKPNGTNGFGNVEVDTDQMLNSMDSLNIVRDKIIEAHGFSPGEMCILSFQHLRSEKV